MGFTDFNSASGGFVIYSPDSKTSTHFREGYETCAIACRGIRFAVALKSGDIYIYEKINNTKNAKEVMQFRISGTPQKLSFSPDGKYMAIFTAGEVYICDISLYRKNNKNDIFRIYKGHFKNKIGVFSDDWEKAYFSNSSGDVLAFDQRFFMKESAYLQRLEKLSIRDKEKFHTHRRKIESYLKK